MNILALQPKEYFDDLGIDNSTHQVDYGPILLTNLEKKIKKYDAVISCIDHSKISRLICTMFRHAGKPAIFFMDGNFDWSNQQKNPYLAKRKIILFEPFCYSEIFITNNPSKQYFRNHCENIKNYLPKRAYTGKVNNHSQANQKILLTTANTPYFDESEYVRLLRLIKKVITASEELKIPIEYRIFDNRLISDLSINNTNNNTSKPFEDALLNATALISTPSTVITTAAAYNIPAASLDYRDTPTFECCGWRIHESVDIPKTIASLVSKESSRLKIQKDLLGNPIEANKIQLLNQNSEAITHSSPATPTPTPTLNIEFILRKIIKNNKLLSKTKNILKKII